MGIPFADPDRLSVLTPEALPRASRSTRPPFRRLILFLIAFTALYAALVSLRLNRHLWFDELVTYRIAHAPDPAQARQWDLIPPLLPVVARCSLSWTGGIPIAIRFPSVIAFYVASLALYVFSRHRIGPAFALLPVLFLWYSPAFQYATEGRPYALLCCFFCLLLAFWDRAVESSPRRPLLLAAIAAASFLLLTSHVLAPLSLLPFAAAEFVRFLHRRRPDFPLWAALFLPLAGTVLYLPLLRNYLSIGHYPPAFQASLATSLEFFQNNFLDVLPCFLLAALAAACFARPVLLRLHATTPRAALFLSLAFLVPGLLDLLMWHDHAPFWGRYAITSTLALYWLFAWLIAALFRHSHRAGFAATVTCSFLLISLRFAVPLSARIRHPAPANVSAFLPIHPDLPLVAASGLTFAEMTQYESPALLHRLVYLRDHSAAIRFANATMFEDLDRFQEEFHLPGTVTSYGAFTRAHRHFLVFGTFDYPEDWLLRKLAASHARITLIGVFDTPYKDKTLYEVWLHDSEP